MADQLKNLMIGIFITAAACIVVFILMFLHPRIGDEGKTLHVRFTDIDKVTIGTRVTYGGKPVGEVVGITEIEEGRKGPRDANGRIYLYDLTLRVDSNVDVYNTDEISLRTSGLLGEKNVEITPNASEEGKPIELVGGPPIYAISTGTVEQTFKEFKEVADKFDKVLDLAAVTITKFNDEKIVDKIANTASNIESITGSLNNPKQWTETLANIHSLTEKALETWKSVDITLANINKAAVSAETLMENGHTLVQKANNGEGTLGKLLNNDELYLRVNSIMSKLETTLDDVNHYGLMFHSDKGWQRLRARRMNLMQTLRTPQEFRNYFNDELDQVNTALSRVYMVWNEMGAADPYCCNMMDNPEYSKVFAELMRRVSMLEEEIRLYNTQVVEVEVHQTELGNPPLCPEGCSCAPQQCTQCTYDPQQQDMQQQYAYPQGNEYSW
jgi:phospholipid/cholesterol/gamma-HCH transport system substrate-binding protein